MQKCQVKSSVVREQVGTVSIGSGENRIPPYNEIAASALARNTIL